MLAHIDGSLVGYQRQGSNFLQLVKETLGNAADPSDGFDAALAAVMSLFPAMDADITHLGETADDITLAMGAFKAIDTTAPFLDFVGALPALASLPGMAKLGKVPPLSLPSLPAPPGAQPPALPPVHCIPAPAPTPAPPAPAPAPTPTPPQPPCPQGWSFVSGKCQPPPVASPGPPGTPPIILPPLPAGLPPCPPSGFMAPGIQCQAYPDPGNTFTNYVLPIGGAVVNQLTAIEMTANATAWLGTATPLLITALPVVGAIIAVAAVLFTILGGGCGAACIDASKQEQVWEAVSDNLYLIGRAGMMTGPEVVAGIHHFFTMGDLALNRLGTPQATSGAINMFKVLNAELAAAALLPAKATVPLTLAAARALYVGGPGWYADSIAYANQLSDQWVAGYIQGPQGG